ncbi:ferric reductase-like transmembrane domain-containing protein [Roseibaca sp. Y0-43]|uniref:ferric reductase-like transmembrane domain-containing protein n=1 Tax=Roseibaca sp. Y0-43 TaxID=2816854 RepID=UPI001D0C092D|nr:ferric reductase-like transmembrane domain-containing protein [Roseibaca sp. Y0-43]MCC1481875.1 ferric reductase-like transmembrane domain-containing protein [Roseibaca sp. Y0-43]
MVNQRLRAVLIWAGVLAAIALPLLVAARSPYLAWRDPVYIASGFAGILGFGLLLLQPLLADGRLPGLSVPRARRVHGYVGLGVLLAVLVHIGGLWLTSPPDVVDALLLRSPTPFSVWGVLAMWAIFAAAAIAALRRKLHVRPSLWRMLHILLAVLIVAGTILHALLIIGTMGTVTKYMLAALVGLATAWLLYNRRAQLLLRGRR